MTTTLGESRDSLLARVRASLSRTPGQPLAEPPPRVDESLARLATVADDLSAMFAERAAAVGMKVYRVEASAVASTIVDILRTALATKVALATGAAGRELDLDAHLRTAGLALVDAFATPGLEGHYDLHAGVTDVHAALAETGTLVCSSGPAAGSTRGLSLVPPVHLALVRHRDLVPDMLDFYARLRGLPPEELPSSIAFITGPSKTADIEGELVTGVHGPGQVHILLYA